MKRQGATTGLLIAVLLGGTGGLVWAAARGTDDRGGEAGVAWFTRHLDPRDDALFLDLEVEDAQRNDLWLLAQRYHGARGEGEPYYQLWRFESGERRAVYDVPDSRLGPHSLFAALRRLDDGTVAAGFLSAEGAPVVRLFDPGTGAWRDWGGSAALRELTPASALVIHPDGGVTVASAGRALSVLTRVDDDGTVRWRHGFSGTAGDLAQVSEIAAHGAGVVALGIRSAEDVATTGEGIEMALVALDEEGAPSAATPLPEQPVQLIPSPAGEVAIAMGHFQPASAVPVATFELEAVAANSAGDAAGRAGTLTLKSKPTAAALPTETRRNKRLAVAHACGDLFAYADEEEAASGKSIRFALVGEQGELMERILTGADPEDPIIVSSISLVPRGEVLYVAATVVKVLETREIRSGIDLYRLDLGDVCGPASEQESMR